MPDRAHSIPLFDAESFWHRSRDAVVFDVRSPGEFAQGHIPGAVSLPLFDDDQRAEIGTIYKNSGVQDSFQRGLKLVGPKMADFVSVARQHAGKIDAGHVFLHCWRGGLRSEAMAWLLKIGGLKPIVLDGGYKAFRAFAQSFFNSETPLTVVSGLTGAGKSDVLDALKAMDEQVVDLERLANHRGSAFGAIGQPPQPTTEQFENDLFQQLVNCDPSRRVWIEDEGNRLGTVVVPPPLVKRIRNAQAIFIEKSSQERVGRLMTDYGDFEPARLIESLDNIRKRLGPQHADEAKGVIRENNIRRAIEIVLDYYDRTYLHAASKMPRPKMISFPAEGMEPHAIAQQLATGNF